MTKKSKPVKPVRHCRICGKPEKITDLGGVKYTDISPAFDTCAKCINKILKEVRP